MEIIEVKLKGCKIDSDFTKINENTYSCVSKAIIGEDNFESIIYLELSDEHYKYITKFNYKELLFNLTGVVQIRKNKKDIPFMFFKTNSIINTEEIAGIKEKKEETVKQKELIENNTKRKDNNELDINTSKWSDCIPGLKDNLIEMKMDKIKIINKIHTRMAMVDLKRNSGIVVVKKIEDTDEYELIIGYATFIKCKLLDLTAKVYVTDKTRKEFVKYLNNTQDAKVNELNE